MTVNSQGVMIASFNTLAVLAITPHNGVPEIFLLFVTTLALGFGIYAAAARSTDPVVRAESMRQAIVSGGVLFFLNGITPWIFNLSTAQSIMAAVAIGLGGTKLIDSLYSNSAAQNVMDLVATVFAAVIKGAGK